MSSRVTNLDAARAAFREITDTIGTTGAARALGCSQSMVSRIRTGDRTPGLHLATRIAKVSSNRIPASAWALSESA